MTFEQMEKIARDNIERHLGDVCDGNEHGTDIGYEAYLLAFDALVDQGVDHETAGVAATCCVAQMMAST